MNHSLSNVLLRHRNSFAPVTDFNAASEKISRLDLTMSSTQVQPDDTLDTDSFSHRIDAIRRSTSSRFLIGGYNELRAMYMRSELFGGDNIDGDLQQREPRRLHLGVDIWGESGTSVFAPLPGVVHSFAFNDRFGDYGATIILTHELEGVKFHSLYGHLSNRDLQPLFDGKHIGSGEEFAHFGLPAENGHWPPHLHFQIVMDIGAARGDYPGVCRLSEKEHFLGNCPDPELVLNLERFIHH